MPFSLTDLRRAYGRSGVRGGAPDVRPHLLVGRELAAAAPRLRRALDWYAGAVGRRRQDVDPDELAQLVGDYRLGRCLAACLQRTYRFGAPDLEQTVRDGDGAAGQSPAGSAGRRRWSHLQEMGIRDPSGLRLHVFDLVARECGGCALPDERDAVLAAGARELRLEPEQLDALLWLDAEPNERLEAVAPPPAVEQLAADYNYRAVETLLVRTLSADLVLPHPDGTAIKRLYFLLKRFGLLTDLSLVDPRRGAAAGVQVHLFGPLEVFGPRTRHGERFARVLLQLLRWFPDLRGVARVLINEREYLFHLDAQVTAAIAQAPPPEPSDADTDTDDEPADGAPAGAVAVVDPGVATGSFDSEVEARLFATLKGMERRDDTRGWTVEREPEPVIVDGTVLVPDFLFRHPAAAEDEPGVYVEVIGFWTPAYRQRKKDKLRLVAGHVPLALVVQEQLAAEFAELPYPSLAYKQRVSAVELVRLVDRHFGRREARRAGAAVELTALLSDTTGPVIPEPALRAAGIPLDDVSTLLPALDANAEWHWLPGFGLYRSGWLDALRQLVSGALGADELALDRLREIVQESDLPHAAAAATVLEPLLTRAGFTVSWTSLFEATVRPKST